MEFTTDPVLETDEMGYIVYNARFTASDIARMVNANRLYYDPGVQRAQIDRSKIDRWTEKSLSNEAIFGTMTINFRTDESIVDGVVHPGVELHQDADGRVVYDGEASVPDGWHRISALVKAVAAAGRGADFDVKRHVSVQIWNVPTEVESAIFYWRNQEGKKADATRSKYLYQQNNGQRIAIEVVRRSPHLTDKNVETVRNSLAKKNLRLAAFNTISTAFEEAWRDIDLEHVPAAVDWFLTFWGSLVSVRPELGLLSLTERQAARKENLVGSAIAIHGYIHLARLFHDTDADVAALSALAEKVTLPDGSVVDFMSYDNPEWKERGVLIPSRRSGLSPRNALQTRREVARAFAERCGVQAVNTLDSSSE
jgi:DNA-sulfur modification-associated